MKMTLIILFLGLTGVGLAAGLWWGYAQLQPASSAAADKYVTVENGSSAGNVASTLEEEGIIRNGTVFYLYTRYHKQTSSIKSGVYRLSPDQPIAEILKVLTEGRTENAVVRIPSGVVLEEIQAILRGKGFEQDDIRAALSRRYDADVLRYKPKEADLEGYLYPDTYHVASNAETADLIEMVLSNTDKYITRQLRNQWREHGLSVHEGLTLASIVQKEVAEPRQRAKVAQVFLTRLENDQPLEADPTFQYAARKKGVEPSIDVKSPHNTYQNKGLPPGPIATSTIEAMEAVANPADTEYRYFVTGEDGVTRFSKTERQHEKYIEKHGVSGSDS